MKLNGRTIKGPNIEYIVIPRNDGDLVFKAQAVLDVGEFDTKVKRPEPPYLTLPGGARKPDINDPGFKGLVEQYSMQRYGFIFLKSLSVTEGLEWETIDMENPETWINWETELKNAGFTSAEITMLMNGVATANGMNAERLEEARSRFLASLTPPPKP